MRMCMFDYRCVAVPMGGAEKLTRDASVQQHASPPGLRVHRPHGLHQPTQPGQDKQHWDERTNLRTTLWRRQTTGRRRETRRRFNSCRLAWREDFRLWAVWRKPSVCSRHRQRVQYRQSVHWQALPQWEHVRRPVFHRKSRDREPVLPRQSDCFIRRKSFSGEENQWYCFWTHHWSGVP